MPALKDIRRKIKAIHNTQKITKAMKMVAAAKLRKVQTRMLNFRPYAEQMHSVITSLAGGAERQTHPLLMARPRKTVEVVVMSGDRGLCGAFNTNIIKAAANYINDLKRNGFEVSVSTVGKKGRDFFRRRGVTLRKSWTGVSGPLLFTTAQEISTDIIENYINETIDEVILTYNEFKSIISQRVSVIRLLPIASLEEKEEALSGVDFLYEPSQGEIFNTLLPKHIEIQVYRSLLESNAAEEAARMSAMENATQNCDELIAKVTLQYNKARQAQITKELMDIVGGVEALK
ncbi:MAG: ATP synthase F1 subunit gamma [Nitrospirae bacterium]|nr:ATP synthase F1 subunit gamma [Nitrospirota bacterium]